MPPLGPIRRRDLIRYFHELGFTGPYKRKRAPHPYMDNGTITVTIPNEHSGEIGLDLLVRILRQAGIDRATWERL